MAKPLVRAVFAALVLATIAAFFVTQQLKSEFPLVIRFSAKPKHFSPNADRYRDVTRVGFDLSEPARVTFSIMDGEGNEVRELVDDRELAGDAKHRFRWDGRDDEGNVVPDGTYRMRVVRRKQGRLVDPSRGKRVAVDIRYRGPSTRGPEFRVWRTDDGPPRIVDRFRGNERRRG